MLPFRQSWSLIRFHFSRSSTFKAFHRSLIAFPVCIRLCPAIWRRFFPNQSLFFQCQQFSLRWSISKPHVLIFGLFRDFFTLFKIVKLWSTLTRACDTHLNVFHIRMQYCLTFKRCGWNGIPPSAFFALRSLKLFIINIYQFHVQSRLCFGYCHPLHGKLTLR